MFFRRGIWLGTPSCSSNPNSPFYRDNVSRTKVLLKALAFTGVIFLILAFIFLGLDKTENYAFYIFLAIFAILETAVFVFSFFPRLSLVTICYPFRLGEDVLGLYPRTPENTESNSPYFSLPIEEHPADVEYYLPGQDAFVASSGYAQLNNSQLTPTKTEVVPTVHNIISISC